MLCVHNPVLTPDAPSPTAATAAPSPLPGGTCLAQSLPFAWPWCCNLSRTVCPCTIWQKTTPPPSFRTFEKTDRLSSHLVETPSLAAAVRPLRVPTQALIALPLVPVPLSVAFVPLSMHAVSVAFLLSCSESFFFESTNHFPISTTPRFVPPSPRCGCRFVD